MMPTIRLILLCLFFASLFPATVVAQSTLARDRTLAVLPFSVQVSEEVKITKQASQKMRASVLREVHEIVSRQLKGSLRVISLETMAQRMSRGNDFSSCHDDTACKSKLLYGYLDARYAVDGFILVSRWPEADRRGRARYIYEMNFRLTDLKEGKVLKRNQITHSSPSFLRSEYGALLSALLDSLKKPKAPQPSPRTAGTSPRGEGGNTGGKTQAPVIIVDAQGDDSYDFVRREGARLGRTLVGVLRSAAGGRPEAGGRLDIVLGEKALNVLPRDHRCRNREACIFSAADKLNATYILIGSLTTAGGGLRFNWVLWDLPRKKILGSSVVTGRYMTDLSDTIDSDAEKKLVSLIPELSSR